MAHPAGTRTPDARACLPMLPPSSEDLALSDVGHVLADAAGMPLRGPATLAVPLSRGGLFYPLASLDISGQWPVFEQEPHLNGRSNVFFVLSIPSSVRRAPESYTCKQ